MSLTLTLARGGGEVSGSGTNIELDGTIAGGAIESVELKGDTEQTTYSGKNLLKLRSTTSTLNTVTFTPNSDGSFDLSGTATAASEFSVVVPVAESGIVANQQYIINSNIDNIGVGKVQYYVHSCDSSGVWKKTLMAFDESNNQIRTCLEPTSDGYIKLVVRVESGFNATASGIKTQLVKGTSAGTWEPYVGGTASPNPDYPQEVQTVTGRQVVTISDGDRQSQEYEINLGDIELCKIGTYQDYIYKSGDDWYVKKETGKLELDGTESWYLSGRTTKVTWNTLGITNVANVYNGGSVSVPAYISCATQTYFDNLQPTSATGEGFALRTDGSQGDISAAGNGIYLYYTGTMDTAQKVTTYLSNNKPTLYYALATPTDTQITNSALIAQLNALNAGTTYDGTTIITVASENLAGPLEVKASSTVTKTYTEVEIGSPFTIADVEGKSSNTTLDGNVYVDWAYNKKQYSFDLFNLTPQDYADIRAFYDYQFNNSAFPTITVPELNIDKLPVYMEISSRNIINQCLLTDKLTIKFRETVQP